MKNPPSTERRLSPLARRYAFRLCGLTLLLLLVSGVVQMYFSYSESLDHIEQLQAAQAENAAREIGTYLASVETALADVAKMPWGTRDFGPSQRREEFYRLMQMVPAIIELSAVDGDGREELAVSRRSPVRERLRLVVDEPELLTVSAESPLARGRSFLLEGAVPTMRIAVFDGQGAVVGTIDLRLLGEIVARLRTSKGGMALIVDQFGQMIAHTRMTEVIHRGDVTATLASHVVQGAQELRGRATTNLHGEPVIVTSAKVADSGWRVYIEQPRSEALEPVLATLSRTLVLMLVGGVAAMLLGLVFARRMAAPIVALRDATSRIVSGQLESDLPVRRGHGRHDEVGDLAEDFNQMVHQLRDLYASLEAKVIERTQELSDARDILEDRASEIELLNARLMAQLDELSLRKDEAERANAAKSRFLAAASHDLRQPMHSISLLIGVLHGRLRDPAQIELADKVQASVTTMENLFGNLLDISKLDAGAVHAHIEDVDLGWLLERAAQTWLPQAQEKGLTLRVRPGRWVVRGDTALLERVVGNLLANAIRYTRSGGVLVGCRRRGKHCELQVWDTGPGIAPEHREAIFEEFFRISTPGSGQEKGLGLGLSIVRRCVQLMDCSITVESREDRGSVFKVLMPLAAPSTLQQKLAGGPTASLHSLEGNFIVVVDDDVTNREAVLDALLVAGCHVVTAARAADALAQLASHLRAPDLVLTDYQLADGADGLAVIRQLRAHYDADIPGLVVTANTDARLLAEARALGAALLHKPVGLQRLMAAIQDALDAKASRPGAVVEAQAQAAGSEDGLGARRDVERAQDGRGVGLDRAE